MKARVVLFGGAGSGVSDWRDVAMDRNPERDCYNGYYRCSERSCPTRKRTTVSSAAYTKSDHPLSLFGSEGGVGFRGSEGGVGFRGTEEGVPVFGRHEPDQAGHEALGGDLGRLERESDGQIGRGPLEVTTTWTTRKMRFDRPDRREGTLPVETCRDRLTSFLAPDHNRSSTDISRPYQLDEPYWIGTRMTWARVQS